MAGDRGGGGLTVSAGESGLSGRADAAAFSATWQRPASGSGEADSNLRRGYPPLVGLAFSLDGVGIHLTPTNHDDDAKATTKRLAADDRTTSADVEFARYSDLVQVRRATVV